MAYQSQKYFFTLLIGRELVREALSDVYEATVFDADDRDVSDGNSWKVNDPLKNRLLNIFQSSGMV